MMMFLKKYINTIKSDPLIFFVGMSVFALAVMGTSVRHVSSTVFALLVILSFAVIKDWGRIYLSLTSLEKILLVTFFLYTASGMLSFYNVDDVDEYYRLFERYLRFTLIIPVYILLIKKNISVLNYLYVGAVISGPFLFVIALHHYIYYPDVPAQGYYHHIIFGQLAILNVGIMLSLLLTKNLVRYIQFIILLSMLLGLATAVMSQARGVWLVFPIYASVAIYYAVSNKRIRTKYVAAFLAIIALLSMFTPIGDLIKQRTGAAISEVTSFYVEDQYVSSVGTRLAMWDIAINVWRNNPFLGTGPGDFDDEIMARQNKGDYVGMEIHDSAHNIFIQALVNTGLIGLVILFLVVLTVPLRIFVGDNASDKRGRLAGFITVLSFAVFGLSESWTLRLPTISIFLVYVVIIASHMHIDVSKNK